ncbi:MAG: LytTR family DNA-binding domain-containing protein [Saprospiraceae bacterium]
MPLRECWIIEDEPPALRRLRQLLAAVRPELKVTFTTDTVAATRRALTELPHPDLILSDIHLADGLSFTIWEEADCRCPIIFTTAYDQYGIRAFRVNSIDYLLKPIEEGDLERSLAKLENLSQPAVPAPDWSVLADMMRTRQPAYRQRFLARHRQELVPLTVDELGQIYSQDGLTFALTGTGQRYLLDEPLDRIAEELDPAHWFRINRAQLAHISAVRRVEPYFNHRLALTLQPDAGLDNVVSRQRVRACKEWLGGG